MHMDQSTAEQMFTEAYEVLSDTIFRHCYFRVFDRERARDLAQESFVRAWRYMAEGHEILNLRAFLYRTAHNLIVDEARRAKPVSLDELHEQGFDPGVIDEGLERRIDGAALLKLVHELGPEYRTAIVMRYVDGLSPKEIAEITGETENAISVRIHRGLKQVRNKLPPNANNS